MGKKIWEDEWINIAPDIRATIQNDEYIVEDLRTGRKLDPKDIDDKIIIYERQVKEWFLKRAHELKKQKNMGFIILMIATAYIEGVQQLKDGKCSKGSSKSSFVKSFLRIFNLDKKYRKDIETFYYQVRCGLFHDGMTGNKIIISSGYEKTIDFSKADRIEINQNKFITKIRHDFSDHISKLKDDKEIQLRANFDGGFSNL